MARPRKNPSPRERNFARLISEGLKPVEAARKAFGWVCEPLTAENQKAKDLARQARIKRLVKEYQVKALQQAAIQTVAVKGSPTDWDSLHKYAFERLIEIRDNDQAPARTRFQAVQALEKLSDPAQDLNLIQRYINTVWGGFTAHCPCCHSDFPLWKVQNKQLDDFRKNTDAPEKYEEENFIDRRLHLIKQAEKRKWPHKTQMLALSAPERHIIGKGAARGGKSFLLAMFGLMFLLLPGVEVWILARVYDDAESEVEYLDNFLKTMFYPVEPHMYDFQFDKKSGEASITTKWGSVLKVKSGKAKGSITGRELEAMLVAEPGWVEGDIFEEVRARMSSRLGRIIALGTPKGFGGFLGRLIRMTSRDMRTGKKIPEGARLIEHGCPWGQSIRQYHIPPQDNPEYVQSEIEAARGELTANEFASEFEGRMVNDANAKFPCFSHEILRPISREWIENSSFVLGVDQGERNFASCLVGWDGEKVMVLDEYFDASDTTIKSNLVKLNRVMKPTIGRLGGAPERWALTIFDADPIVEPVLSELEDEHRPWQTEYTSRPKNVKDLTNWREETCLWANELAREGKLFFDGERADLLFEQLHDALIRPVPDGMMSRGVNKKGWIIDDPWRGDHVPDAWLLAMWTLYAGMVSLPKPVYEKDSVWEEHRKALEYNRLREEKAELTGFASTSRDNELYEDIFNRPRTAGSTFGIRGHYRNES